MSLVDQLVQDHEAVRRVLRPLEVDLHAGVVTPMGASIAAHTLLGLVHPHAQREEALVGRAQFVPPVAHLLGEHRQLEALLERARSGEVEALDQATHLLWGHFQEEERDVFPLLRSVGL